MKVHDAEIARLRAENDALRAAVAAPDAGGAKPAWATGAADGGSGGGGALKKRGKEDALGNSGDVGEGARRGAAAARAGGGNALAPPAGAVGIGLELTLGEMPTARGDADDEVGGG